MNNFQRIGRIFALLLSISLLTSPLFAKKMPELRRAQPLKPTYQTLPSSLNTDRIIFKLQEGTPQTVFTGTSFSATGSEWKRLNSLLSGQNRATTVQRHFPTDITTLNQMRKTASQRVGWELPDLSLYFEVELSPQASAQEKLEMINELNALDIVEIAYFPSPPQLPSVQTPNWEAAENYLQPAPTGIDAYYAWGVNGGKGENIKVVDIEGNWVESHEDLHGGTDHFHIAGSKIPDPDWYHHGTAVLGEIAADSNSFGMTGIAFNVDLGTVSIGSMSTASAINTAVTNTDTGDVILIELQIYGPHNNNFVPVEYEQATFDAILQATALGRIVVEAGANGAENLDDTTWYGRLFDPDYRFSGAIMIAASDGNHAPASFTDYGKRMDVHAYGTWNVYTLGYGDLYGTDTTNYYTATFAGTSSASPIITGACAVLQGIHKATHGTVLDHNEMRSLLQDFSTPQASSPKHIGPMPDLRGSVDQVVGVSFYADTTIGWVPFPVHFYGSSALAVDSWSWDFGDGETDTLQSPAHTYTTPGLFSVSLEINAGGDIRTMTKPNYIIALADSLIPQDTAGAKGTQVEVTVNARNSVPMRLFKIPVEYNGTLNLSLDSFSTVGCRTEYFENQSYLHFDVGNKRVTIKLESSSSGSSPDLSAGSGAILKLYFSIPPSASDTESAIIELDGYSTYLPEFSGFNLTYTPILSSATVSVCLERGDLDGIPGVTVSDITYLVNYLFKSGAPPTPLEAADVNCSDGVNVADLTYLVQYLFASGPPPCSC